MLNMAKTSKAQQAKTRRKILLEGANTITEKGFKNATMREIAQRAGVGDATIYNYFPSKEKLLYAYCEQKQDDVATALKSIDDFHLHSLKDQLHQFVETELDEWRKDREFLQEVFRLTFLSPATSVTNLAETRSLFSRMVEDLIDAAIEAEEIPEQPYRELFAPLMWDYMAGVLAYWLKDDSEQFANTTQLVDRSIDIIAVVLHTGLIGKALDMLSFVLRSQLGNYFEQLDQARAPYRQAKRRFMVESGIESQN